MSRLLVLLLALGSATAAGTGPGEAWVDPSAPSGGDGTPSRPFTTVADALAAGAARIHLSSGVHRGSHSVSRAVELIGTGASVLIAADGRPVLRSTGALRLSRVRIVGGDTALELDGTARLERVRFEGQQLTAVRVLGGEVRIRHGDFRTHAPTAIGVRAEGGARVVVSSSRFSGGFRFGIDGRGGASLELDRCAFLGVGTALTLHGAQASVRRTSALGGRAHAFQVAAGTLELERVAVGHHTDGLFVNPEATARVRGLRVLHTTRGAIAVVRGRLQVDRAYFDDPGVDAAILVMGGQAGLSRVAIRGAGAFGIQVRNGELGLRRVWITDTRARDEDLGDALNLRAARAHLERALLVGASGACILAAENAEVSLTDVFATGCRAAGVFIDTDARVRIAGASRLDARISPAVVVLEAGKAFLESLKVEGSEAPLAARCADGAKIEVAPGLRRWSQPDGCISVSSGLPRATAPRPDLFLAP